MFTKFRLLKGKHQRYTLLRWCGTECKISYWIRTAPPLLTEEFVLAFDKLLKSELSACLDCNQTVIKQLIWRRARLPTWLGGLCLRTGVNSYGAFYATSVMKCRNEISRVLQNFSGPLLEFNAHHTAMTHAGKWLSNILGVPTEKISIFLSAIKPLRNLLDTAQDVPTTQSALMHEAKRTRFDMSDTLNVKEYQCVARHHIESNRSGCSLRGRCELEAWRKLCLDMQDDQMALRHLKVCSTRRGN